jgi:hypothetical protein
MRFFAQSPRRGLQSVPVAADDAEAA